MKFLSNPAKIRRHLVKSLETSDSLDAAVAFIGRDWADIIGTFAGPVRLICWLSSTNTNPYAVEQMIMRENICVHHLPAMHAKVYLLGSQAPRCIVGSANLSENALSENNASGQHEAAIEAKDEQTTRAVKRWFENLWEEARPVSTNDLSKAKDAWNKAQSGRANFGNRANGRQSINEISSLLPNDWKPSENLVDLANKVRNTSPEFDKSYAILSRVLRRGRNVDLMELIKLVAKWTGHEGKYHPASEEPPERIRKAFRILFDRSRSMSSRLCDLDVRGEHKIKGFGLTSLTMILYWRFPREYPPFNGPTKTFLRDFEFQDIAPKSLTPAQYARWIAFAQELSQRLNLPSSGHIDRIVREYTRGPNIS